MTTPSKQFTPNTTPTEYLGEPEGFLIPRYGDRDLAFDGWRLSRAEECRDAREWIQGKLQKHEACLAVAIYLTTTDRLVAHVERFKRVGDTTKDHEHVVDVFDVWTPAHAVEWLKEDNGGRLGQTSKRAWIEACNAWPRLKNDAVERI